MIYLGVLFSVFVVCLARPEPPGFGGYSATGHDYSSSFGGSGGGFGSPSSQYGVPGGGIGGIGGIGGGIGGIGGIGGHGGHGGHGGIGGGIGGIGGAGGVGGIGGIGGAPVVHKHVYVHIPPAETPVFKPKKIYPQPLPQKHYKIVFIKAPTPPAPTVPDLPPLPPPDEQKTLIYVLVKKPEEQPEIIIPTPAPTKPSKPEVYFIRYKTQKQEGGADGGGSYASSGHGSGSFSGSAGGSSGSGSSGPSGPSGSYGVPSSGGY